MAWENDFRKSDRWKKEVRKASSTDVNFLSLVTYITVYEFVIHQIDSSFNNRLN